MNPVYVFNAFEAVLWAVIATVLLFMATRHRQYRFRLLLSGLAFMAFAGSDIMEMQTGAWWRPWWLLAWKAACVILLVGVAIYDNWKNKQEHAESTSTASNDFRPRRGEPIKES